MWRQWVAMAADAAAVSVATGLLHITPALLSKKTEKLR